MKKLQSILGMIAIGVALTTTASYATLPHGCISVASAFSVSPDLDRRSLTAQMNTNGPCTFFYSPGDTFSGSGEYKISCATGGSVTDSLEQRMQSLRPIPQPCAPGARVTVESGHTGQGGAVVAGSPTFVAGAPGLAPAAATSSNANTHTVRYIAAGWQNSNEWTDAPSPVGRVAYTGGYQITPTGTTVKVTIADDLAPTGSFLFSICQRNAPHAADYHCGQGHDDVTTGDICYTGPETLSGVIPGNPVEVFIWTATSPCPDSATTGTLTVVG